MSDSAENTKAAERYTMDRIGDIKRIPALGLPRSDAFIIVGCAIGGFMLGSYFVAPFGMTILGCLFGVMLVRASVSYKPTFDWVLDIIGWVWRPRRIYAASQNAPDKAKNEGGLANYTPFAPDTRAQDLTMVDLVWPGAGAILRTDYHMEAMVEIVPDQMDHAQSEDWAAMYETCTAYANTNIDTGVKFHVMTEPFDLGDVEDRLDDRLSDPSIQERPTLEALLIEYREQRPKRIRERGTQEPRFFVSVAVADSEIDSNYQQERGALEKLARTPVVGLLFSPFVTRSADLEDAELYSMMFEKLNQRVRTVEQSLIQRTDGYTGRRLSTIEMMSVLAQQTNNHPASYKELDAVVRESPVIGHAPSGRFENDPDGLPTHGAGQPVQEGGAYQ